MEKKGYDNIKINNKTQIFLKIFLLLFIIILILNKKVNLLLIYSIMAIKNKYINKTIFKDLDNIKLNYKFNGINYLNKCLNKKIIIKNNDMINSPKISVIIPVYNCQNSIQISIKSIQYQKLKEYEIILVNDYSNDKSLEIIENIKKYDKRIKIINNQKNMGTLYSRSIGSLAAKGKYIFALDNDDIFFNENLFENIYHIVDINDFDIVEFKSFNIPNYHPNINQIGEGYHTNHKSNLTLKQPNLGVFPISKNKRFYPNDYFIWGKCIKSHIYKRAVNTLGFERYSKYNIWTEDISIVIIIFNIAESYIFLNIYGILHLISKSTTSYKISRNHRIISKIYLLDILIDHLKNDYQSKIYAVYLVNTIKRNEIRVLNYKQKLFFKSVLQKIINCRYITKKNKSEIDRLNQEITLTQTSKII